MHRKADRQREPFACLKGCKVFRKLKYIHAPNTCIWTIHSLVLIATMSGRCLSFKYSLVFTKYKITQLPAVVLRTITAELDIFYILFFLQWPYTQKLQTSGFYSCQVKIKACITLWRLP